MSFPTYVDPIPLPAPVTTGTTTQSYTDPLGDVWVAKNGVSGGNWFRARDVAYAKVARATALTATATTWTAMPYDTAVADAYGLYTLGTGGYFTCPVTGRYLVAGRYSIQAAASMRAIIAVYKTTPPAAGAEYSRGNDITTAAYMGLTVSTVVSCVAGDRLQVDYYVGLANAFEAISTLTWADFQYLGTG